MTLVQLGPGVRRTTAPAISTQQLDALNDPRAINLGVSSSFLGDLGRGILDSTIDAARQRVSNLVAGTGGTSFGGCPEGTFQFPGTDKCVSPGDMFPGGAPAVFGAGGATGIGPLGLFASPELENVPTLRCPPRTVLATDNMCYDKAALPKRFRKWIPGPKPAVSGHDRAMMRKYGPGGSKVKAVKRLASQAGFVCAKKGSSRGGGKKKK